MESKKGSLVVMFLVTVSAFSATLSVIPDNAEAGIRYVGGVGPGNYTTIQSAIDAANDDDTVFVFNGTYVENIVVRKDLSLFGEHGNATIIDGGGNPVVVWIEACTVTMSGFSVTNGSSWAISLADSASTTISNNNISGNSGYGLGSGRSPFSTITNNIISKNVDDGVVIFDSLGNTIANNNISGNYGGVVIYDDVGSIINGNNISNNVLDGIYFYNSTSTTVSNNYLLNNNEWGTTFAESSSIWFTDNLISNSNISIRLIDSSWHLLSGNTMEGGSIFLSGDQIEYWNTHTIDSSNILNGKPVYFCKNTLGGTIPSGAGQVILANCDGVTVENQDFSNLYYGMLVGYSSGNIIINNTVLSSDRIGIYLQASSGNLIVSNNISDSGNGGIHVDPTSSANSIMNNTASRNGHGVLLDSPGNFLAGNILNNNSNGVYLASSDNNRIANNTIFSNLRGVVLRSSIGNEIYHNNILGNGIQAEDFTSANLWDNGYPSGGNYWSDYAGTDTKNGVNQDLPGSDGIGDIPYNITGGLNQDRYPLMDPLAVLPSVPSEPQNLNATAGNQQVSLSWSPPVSHGGAPITDYRIYRGNISGGESFLVEVGNVLAYVDSGLMNGQTFYYQVSAVNVAGEGPKSTEANATPTLIPTVPSEPQNPLVTPGDGLIDLTWDAPLFDGNSSITNYRLYRGTTSGGEAFLLEIGNITMYDDTGLTNGQTYYYKVSAVNAIGEGPKSNEASATPATIPTPPQNLVAMAGDREASLSWDPPSSDGGSSVTSYRIYRGTTPGGEVFLTEVGNVTSYVDIGLSPGQTYYYQVSAMNVVGEGPISNETHATPTTMPGAPTTLQARLTGSGFENITITWSLSSDDGSGQDSVVGYEVYQNLTYDSNGLSYQLSSFIPNGSTGLTIQSEGEGDPNNHFFRICAVDFNGLKNCTKEQAGKFTRPLSKGPNLISIPFIQSDESLQTVLQTVSYDNAWSYDPINQEWRSFSISKPYGGTLQSANHTMGIWVDVTQDSNFTVAGVVPTSTTINLQAGWNLVGFPSFDDNYTVADLKAALAVERMEGFEGLAPPYSLKVMLDVDFLQAGFGYWIMVESEASWTIVNS
jgi:parallel beta-helix repeat protein